MHHRSMMSTSRPDDHPCADDLRADRRTDRHPRSITSRVLLASLTLVGATVIGTAAPSAAQAPPPLPSATTAPPATWSSETVDAAPSSAPPTTKAKTRQKAARTTTTTRRPAPTTTAPATNPDIDIDEDLDLSVVEVPRPPAAAAARAAAAPDTSAPRSGDAGDVWYRLRMCESRNNYSINTGNGYYGAYQFALQTWRALGFTGFPHEAPPAVQDEAARKLQARAGWGQWPACARKLGLR